MSTELEDFLERERQLGIYESTGVFTLSLAEARRKLSQYQLGSLEMAVLKLIQALVQLEAEVIWIESEEQSFTLNWADARQELEPEQFASNLEQVMLGDAGPARDMAIGLGGFLDREPAEIWWAHWENHEMVRLLNLLGSGRKLEIPQPAGFYRRAWALRVRGGTQALTLNRDIIAQRCLFAPVPILWNGKLVCELAWNPPGYVLGQAPYWADFYYPTLAPKSAGLALKPIGRCRELDLTGWTSLECFAPSQSKYTVYHRLVAKDQGTPVLFSGRRPRSNALTAEVRLQTLLGESIWVVSGADYAPSALLCVKHGVLLNPCRMPVVTSGLVAVISTPNLEVDLSQFTPREQSQSWTDLLATINARAQSIIDFIQSRSSRIYRAQRDVLPTVGGGGLVGAVLGAAMPMPLAGASLGALGVMLAILKYYEYTHRRRLLDLQQVALRLKRQE